MLSSLADGKKKNNNCVMGKKIVKIDKNIKETDPSR